MHTRKEAWELLTQWTKSQSLLKHALSVEAAMRHYADLFKEDQELWGNTGLLHDFDYEQHPDPKDHPRIGMELLKKEGWPEAMIHAIAGHALYLNVPRENQLDKTLFAVDELCGLIIAVAYTRPNRTLAEVEVKSILKKLKDKTFAKGVNRDDVELGVQEMGIPLEEHVANCLTGLQKAAPQLGL